VIQAQSIPVALAIRKNTRFFKIPVIQDILLQEAQGGVLL
jgi:hypothetical protein